LTKDKESFSNLLKADERLLVKGFKDKCDRMLEVPQVEGPMAEAMRKAVAERNMKRVRNLFKHKRGHE
jgi:hypothetical protein